MTRFLAAGSDLAARGPTPKQVGVAKATDSSSEAASLYSEDAGSQLPRRRSP